MTKLRERRIPPAPGRTNRRGRTATNRSRVAVRVAHRFNVSPKDVFDAWLDPNTAGKWLFATALHPMRHVEIDPRVEGSFRMVDHDGVEYIGEYSEITPHRRLVFTLFMENRPTVPTRVVMEITPLKKGCTLTVSHENLPPDCARYTEARWTGALYGLGVTL